MHTIFATKSVKMQVDFFFFFFCASVARNAMQQLKRCGIAGHENKEKKKTAEKNGSHFTLTQ